MEFITQTDIAMWVIIVSFFMPHMIAIVQQSTRRWVRMLTTVVTNLVAGAGIVYFTDPDYVTTENVVTVGLAMVVMSITLYENFWKRGGGIDRIESATTLR